jgi:hypothetical protein
LTGRISIAQIARESVVDYFRVWKVTASTGGWDGLTKDEAARLIAVLEEHGLGDDVTTVSPESTPRV